MHAQTVRATGGHNRRPPVTDQRHFTQRVRAPIGNAVAQGIVAVNGTAILSLGPQGIGTRWYASQILVATSSGASDQSACTIYRQLIDPTRELGRTEQGGSDVFNFPHDMQPGDLIIAKWQRANTGDIATLTIHGDQDALTPEW